MDYTKKSPVILSICPGLLGLERGLARAFQRLQWQKKPTIAAYVEIEAFICANLVSGMESGLLETAPIWTDVKTFNPQPFCGKIDGYIGGYPCQPFSVAGKQKGTEDPRHLWPYIQRHIEAIKPVWCFFENVRGHLTCGYPEVHASLSNLGYAVEPGIFTAEEVGAPHQRERLFILAIRKDELANAKSKRTLSRSNEHSSHTGRRQQLDRTEQGSDFGNNGKSELAYPDSLRNRTGFREVQETNGEISERNNDAITQQSGESELADTDSSGHGRQHTGGFQSETEPSSEELGNTNNTRQRQPSGPITMGTQQPPVECTGTFNGWPAGPGQPQYEWEEPRTVKPGVGSTVNGYNFREDFLRGLGNSVVEQTAEVAFITLLEKHFNLLKKEKRQPNENTTP